MPVRGFNSTKRAPAVVAIFVALFYHWAIGNPQNLFLWHRWGISFLEFIVRMLPVTVLVFGVLVLFARWAFPDRNFKQINPNRPCYVVSSCRDNKM